MTGNAPSPLAELARQIAATATLEGEFVLRSGQVSNRYFDKYRFEGNPVLLRELAKAMASCFPHNRNPCWSGTRRYSACHRDFVGNRTSAAFIRKEAKPMARAAR